MKAQKLITDGPAAGGSLKQRQSHQSGAEVQKTTLLGLSAAWEMLSAVFFECFKHA